MIVFGLGNPGAKYRGTRHNVGFDTVERIAALKGIKLRKRCFRLYRKAVSDSLVLIQPLTYMNSSGDIAPECVKGDDTVVVIVDQMDLPPGRVRLRSSGSSAGHNGLKSMMAYLPGNFKRLYVGVGRPEDGIPVIEHVLSRYSEEDRKRVDAAQRQAVSSLRQYIEGEEFSRTEQTLNSFRGDIQ